MSDGFHRLWLSEKHARLEAERDAGLLREEVRTERAARALAVKSLQDVCSEVRELRRMTRPTVANESPRTEATAGEK